MEDGVTGRIGHCVQPVVVEVHSQELEFVVYPNIAVNVTPELVKLTRYVLTQRAQVCMI